MILGYEDENRIINSINRFSACFYRRSYCLSKGMKMPTYIYLCTECSAREFFSERKEDKVGFCVACGGVLRRDWQAESVKLHRESIRAVRKDDD